MKTKLIILLHASCILLLTSHAYAFVAAPNEDVANTRHNLSSSGPAGRTVTTAQTTEICVFCHTPHGANPDVATLMGAPIWNRRVLATGYQLYDQVWSKSFEGVLNDPTNKQPTGFSRLCLSCHDGTIALGRVINPPGSGGFVPSQAAGESSPTGVPIITDPTLKTFDMTYSAGPPSQDPTLESPARPAGSMPTGGGVMTGSTASGILSGDTRMLGTELRNDHPISFIFDSNLSNINKDDELQALVTYPLGRDLLPLGTVSLTNPNVDPDLAPLKRHVGTSATKADTIQCTSCHNPHQKDYPKFLRADRVQRDFSGPGTAPSSIPGSPPIAISQADRKNKLDHQVDGPKAIICVFCHDKPGVPYGKPDVPAGNVATLYSAPDDLGYPKGLSTHFTDPTLLKSGATDLAGTTADQLSSVINKTPTPVSVRERACLACHDPHTEQGSIRLLRAGASNAVADTPTPSEPDKAVAIEQTCYMCHSPTNEPFNIIANGAGLNECPPAGGNFPDCPPDVLTQFRKDTGSPSAPAGADPAFTLPEFSLTQAYPAGETPPPIIGVPDIGSAMNLRLGLGHQPVFTNLPREGVQLGSDNSADCGLPTFGGSLPGINSCTETLSFPNKEPVVGHPQPNDTKHVECVDCHNMHRVNRTNRFKGMPGITIGTGDTNMPPLDNSGASVVLVTQTLTSALSLPQGGFNATTKVLRREPYIFEVCLRCHGNSFNQHVAEQRVVANGTGLVVQLRGNNPVRDFSVGYGGAQTSFTLGGGSNKRKEFDPNSKPFYNQTAGWQPATGTLDPTTPPRLVSQTPINNGLPGSNTAFHPVATIGKNQSGVLNNMGDTPPGQLMGVDKSGNKFWRKSTIHCTDCHNTNLFGTFGSAIGFILPNSNPTPPGPGAITYPYFPGPITFDETRGAAYKRTSDLGQNSRRRNLTDTLVDIASTLNDPTKPQGPHGSIWRRILRSNYSTDIPSTDGGKNVLDYDSQNFALCFNCHNEEAFTRESWPTPDLRLTNFYRRDTGGKLLRNLHAFHLYVRANAKCHECHYNVHSNIESGNALYFNLPGLEALNNGFPRNPGHASSTHLINFAPEVGVNNYQNPVWGNGPDVNSGDTLYRGPGCNLKCHGQMMIHNYDAHSVDADAYPGNWGGKCFEDMLSALPGGVQNCDGLNDN